MHKFSKLTSLLVLCLSLVQPLSAKIDVYFATPNGSDTSSCAQSDPCSIATAIATAVDKDVIFLGEGNYTSSAANVVTINKSITLIGGWDGTLALPVVYDSERFVSVIDGQYTRRGIIIEPQKNVQLESLTIANTHADDNGSGIYDFNATSLTLNDVTFYHNVATTASSFIYGAGLFISEGTLDINATTFQRNLAKAATSGFGGALSAHNTEVSITNSTFNNNSAWNGSAIYVNSQNKPFTLADSTAIQNGYSLYLDGTPGSGGYGILSVTGAQSRVENSLFQDNHLFNSNTLNFVRGSLLFKNNIVASNESARVSGLLAFQVDPLLVINNIFNDNNTTMVDSSVIEFSSLPGVQNNHIFVNNTLANNSSTYQLYLSASSLAAANNIFANGETGLFVDGSSALDIYNSLYASMTTQIDGTGTISTTDDVVGDAHFVNEATQNYHIRGSSAAIDNGLCIDASPDDIDGDVRDVDGLCDIGADEYVPSGLSPSIVMYLLN